jgi:hypothetical protein
MIERPAILTACLSAKSAAKVFENTAHEIITLYKNENSYFKISKKDIDAKFNKVSVDGFKLPWFAGDDGKYILKVKFKNVKLPDMIKENMYVTNISFKYYNIDNNEGYYVNTISRILYIEK